MLYRYKSIDNIIKYLEKKIEVPKEKDILHGNKIIKSPPLTCDKLSNNKSSEILKEIKESGK